MLMLRPRKPRAGYEYAPTPEEIAERVAAIQSRWTPEDREERWLAARTVAPGSRKVRNLGRRRGDGM